MISYQVDKKTYLLSKILLHRYKFISITHAHFHVLYTGAFHLFAFVRLVFNIIVIEYLSVVGCFTSHATINTKCLTLRLFWSASCNFCLKSGSEGFRGTCIY